MIPTTTKTACAAATEVSLTIPQCYFYSWWIEDEAATASVDSVTVSAPVIYESTRAYQKQLIEEHVIGITSSANSYIVLEYWR